MMVFLDHVTQTACGCYGMKASRRSVLLNTSKGLGSETGPIRTRPIRTRPNQTVRRSPHDVASSPNEESHFSRRLGGMLMIANEERLPNSSSGESGLEDRGYARMPTQLGQQAQAKVVAFPPFTMSHCSILSVTAAQSVSHYFLLCQSLVANLSVTAAYSVSQCCLLCQSALLSRCICKRPLVRQSPHSRHRNHDSCPTAIVTGEGVTSGPALQLEAPFCIMAKYDVAGHWGALPLQGPRLSRVCLLLRGSPPWIGNTPIVAPL
jgi:hypothetical protein